MKPIVLTKADCVRRARNINHQAIAWRECGKRAWAREAFRNRDRYMAAARLFA